MPNQSACSLFNVECGSLPLLVEFVGETADQSRGEGRVSHHTQPLLVPYLKRGFIAEHIWNHKENTDREESATTAINQKQRR